MQEISQVLQKMYNIVDLGRDAEDLLGEVLERMPAKDANAILDAIAKHWHMEEIDVNTK